MSLGSLIAFFYGLLFLAMASGGAAYFLIKGRWHGPFRREELFLFRLGEKLEFRRAGGRPVLGGVPLVRWFRKPYHVEGALGGRRAKISHRVMCTPGFPGIFVVAEIEVFNANQLRLEMRPKGMLTRIRLWTGRHWGVDASWHPQFTFLRSTQGEWIRASLLPEIRQELNKLYSDYDGPGWVELDGNHLRYRERGRLDDPRKSGRILFAMNILGDLADAVEVGSGRR